MRRFRTMNWVDERDAGQVFFIIPGKTGTVLNRTKEQVMYHRFFRYPLLWYVARIPPPGSAGAPFFVFEAGAGYTG